MLHFQVIIKKTEVEDVKLIKQQTKLATIEKRSDVLQKAVKL